MGSCASRCLHLGPTRANVVRASAVRADGKSPAGRADRPHLRLRQRSSTTTRCWVAPWVAQRPPGCAHATQSCATELRAGPERPRSATGWPKRPRVLTPTTGPTKRRFEPAAPGWMRVVTRSRLNCLAAGAAGGAAKVKTKVATRPDRPPAVQTVRRLEMS